MLVNFFLVYLKVSKGLIIVGHYAPDGEYAGVFLYYLGNNGDLTENMKENNHYIFE